MKGLKTLDNVLSGFIQNLTVQDNVLFGSKMDEDRYVETLDACELSQDLLNLPNADHTEIGERGTEW